MTTLGKRIRELRGDVSIAELSSELENHRNTLLNYESDRKKPNADFLVSLCNKFKANADWLLLGEGPKYWKDKKKKEAQQIDMEALVDAIDTIEQILHDKKKAMTPANKAEIIAKIYEYYLDEEPGKSKEKIYNLLKLVA